MTPLLRRLSPTCIVLTVALAASLGYHAAGQRGNASRPTVVGVVNLSKVLEGLEARAAAEVELNAMRDEMVADSDSRQAALKLLKEQRDAATDPASRDRLDEELALEALKYEAWVEFTRNEVDIEQSLRLHDLYRSITRAAGELAQTSGYDLVLVDDSAAEMGVDPESRVSREAQILQQIRARRVIYAATEIDITQTLVTRMNNAFRLAGP